MWWQALHSRDVFRGSTRSNLPPCHGSLYASCRSNSPQPWSCRRRLRPDFAATFVPGFSMVPLAEAVMLTTRRSSLIATAWFLLIALEALWIWSFLMLAIFACSRVILRLIFTQFLENFTQHASACCKTASRAWHFLKAFAPSMNVPSESAAQRLTPRSIPTTSPTIRCCKLKEPRAEPVGGLYPRPKGRDFT